jgi:hypothetical protein
MKLNIFLNLFPKKIGLKEQERQKFPNIKSLVMKIKTQSTSKYFVYIPKSFSFLILGCYINADKDMDNTSCHNLKPTAIYMDSRKGKTSFNKLRNVLY